MKNKASLIPVVLIALVGIVFASGAYFPDNSSLPRTPTLPGTIAGAISSLFAPDGTATNTEKLGGITATGYLHSSNCTDPINKKWVGVDANGKGICGVGVPIFAAIGRFSNVGPGVQVMKNGSSTWTPANTTDDLYPGDTISTNGGTATIDFALDDSILRLDTSTVVELRVGDLDGNSVAEAILSDGRLWGRILTSTGVNLGGGGTVAGVRGTSVSIEKTGPSYVMSIIDSQRPANAAIVVPAATLPRIDKTTGTTIISEGTTTAMPAYSQVNSYSGYVSAYISPIVSTRENLISMSPWIRENTKSDIEYLYTNSGKTNFIKNEYNITVPDTISTPVLTALCVGGNGESEIYWKSLIGTAYDKCQSSSLLAFGEYDKSSLLYFSDITLQNSLSGSTNNPIYHEYFLDSSQKDKLRSKIISIELTNPIEFSVGKNQNIAYFGTGYLISNFSYSTGGVWLCRNGTSTSYDCLTAPIGALKIELLNNGKQVNISLPSSIFFSDFIFGNGKSGGITKFPLINNSIKKIEILN